MKINRNCIQYGQKVTFETCGVVQNVGSRLEILNLRSNERLGPVDEAMLGILEHIADQVSERKVRVFVDYFDHKQSGYAGQYTLAIQSCLFAFETATTDQNVLGMSDCWMFMTTQSSERISILFSWMILGRR